MSKGLRTLIALLCAVSFGVCGFSVYKVVETDRASRSSVPAAAAARPMPRPNTPVPRAGRRRRIFSAAAPLRMARRATGRRRISI